MTNESKLRPTDIVTPECRLAFPALFQPKPRIKGSEDLKYQATLLIPPGTNLEPFWDRVKAAMMEKWGKLVQLRQDRNPIKPCENKPDMNGYEPGWFFMNTLSGYQPAVVGPDRQPIIDESIVYPGCWCHFALNAYAWDNQFGQGVSFGLNAVQFVRNDERLDGRKNVEDFFEPIEIAADPGDVTGTAPAANAADLFS